MYDALLFIACQDTIMGNNLYFGARRVVTFISFIYFYFLLKLTYKIYTEIDRFLTSQPVKMSDSLTIDLWRLVVHMF